jgi:hypothetical protein
MSWISSSVGRFSGDNHWPLLGDYRGQELIAEKKFREDLYYRLSMIEIELPWLADKREDLALLQRFFIEQFAEQYGKPIKGMTPRAQIVLTRYPWPGNIRELRSVFASACMMAEGELIDVRDLPPRIRTPAAETEPENPNELLPLAEIERRHVLRVLEQVGGNKVRPSHTGSLSAVGKPCCTRPRSPSYFLVVLNNSRWPSEPSNRHASRSACISEIPKA